jgi:hypothetical protein
MLSLVRLQVATNSPPLFFFLFGSLPSLENTISGGEENLGSIFLSVCHSSIMSASAFCYFINSFFLSFILLLFTSLVCKPPAISSLLATLNSATLPLSLSQCSIFMLVARRSLNFYSDLVFRVHLDPFL